MLFGRLASIQYVGLAVSVSVRSSPTNSPNFFFKVVCHGILGRTVAARMAGAIVEVKKAKNIYCMK